MGATRPIRPLEIEYGSEGDANLRRAWQKAIAAMPEGGEIPNYGDFTRITPEEAFGIDVLVGGTPCFPAGTLVLTEKGYRPIEEIKCGDKVVSGEGRLCEVTATGSKFAETLELLAGGRPALRATPNHPFNACASVPQTLTPDGNPQMLPIGDVPVGGWLQILSPAFCQGKIDIPAIPNGLPELGISEADFWEIMGIYLAAGRCRSGDTEFHLSYEISNYFRAKFGRLFPSQTHTSKCVRQTGNCFGERPAIGAFVLRNFGDGENARMLPAWAHALAGDARTQFLAGYRRAVGTSRIEKDRTIAYGIADMLGWGIEETPTGFHFTGDGPAYDVISNAYRKIEGKSNGTTEPVYNITVAGDHTYICEGFIVHNCQDLSIAGKRAGFGGQRSVLALDFVRLAYESKTKWVLWENVPGVFSSNGGADFATFLSLLCGKEIGTPEGGWPSAGFIRSGNDKRFSLAWRVLDAQYARVDGFEYAIPQRRRRVFVVGHLGDDAYPAEVLLEPEMLFGDNPPGRAKIKGNPAFASGGASEPGRDSLRGGACGGAGGAGQGEGGAGGDGNGGDGGVAGNPGVGTGAAGGGHVATEAISFEPGIAKREGGDSRYSEELSSTLRAGMGDNQTAVCTTPETPEA